MKLIQARNLGCLLIMFGWAVCPHIFAQQPDSGPQYQVIILPQLDPDDGDERVYRTTPAALNDEGWLAGATGHDQGFRWSPEHGPEMLLPAMAEVAEAVTAASIDGIGNVVGDFVPLGGFFGDSQAFMYSVSGDITVLPPLVPDLSSSAFGVNASGLVVGSAVSQMDMWGGTTTAVYWENGQIHEIGGFGGFLSRAFAVNDHGVVVGFANSPEDWAPIPFRWTEQGGLEELEALGDGLDAMPAAVNNSGLIAGYAVSGAMSGGAVYWDLEGRIHALPMLDPGSPYSIARGLNEDGVIVGQELDAELAPSATVWIDGEIFDLNQQVVDLPAGYRLRDALAINNLGMIAAEAVTENGNGPGVEWVGVLLVPLGQEPGPTPPSPIAVPTNRRWSLLVLTVLLLMIGLHWRRLPN